MPKVLSGSCYPLFGLETNLHPANVSTFPFSRDKHKLSHRYGCVYLQVVDFIPVPIDEVRDHTEVVPRILPFPLRCSESVDSPI